MNDLSLIQFEIRQVPAVVVKKTASNITTDYVLVRDDAATCDESLVLRLKVKPGTEPGEFASGCAMTPREAVYTLQPEDMGKEIRVIEG